jgi:hypothetical protein
MDNQNQNQQQNQQQQNNNENQSSTNSQKTENMVPQSRLNEEIQKKKDIQAQLDEILKKQQEAETDAKKKQGEFETLYNSTLNQLNPLKDQFKQYQDTFNEILKVKLSSVPEEFKSLIPEMDDLSKLKWLEHAEAKGLFKSTKVDSFGNQGNNPTNQNTDLSKLSPTQLMSMAFTKTKN